MALSPVAGALLLAGALLGLSAVAAWRRRGAPAAGAFAVAVGVTGLGALAVATSVLLGLSTASVVAPTLLVALVLPVPWLLFALEYTGRTEMVTSGFTVLVSLIPALGVLATAVIFGSRLVPWLTLPSQESATALVALGVALLGLLQWLGLLYAGGLMFVASGLVVLTFQRYRYLDSTAGLLLGVFGTVPWVSLLFGFQVVGVDPRALPWTVAVGFLIGGVAAGLGLQRYHLFRGVPAIGNVGPTTVLEELDDGMFVTDETGRVVDLNPAAERLVDADATTVVGADIERYLGVPLADLEGVDHLDLDTAGGRRRLEPRLSTLADQHGHRLGYAVVLRDVTARTTRQQRLDVLNRVLRHNLRNKMSLVFGHAEFLRRGIDDPDLLRNVDAIVDAGEELVGLSESAQEVDQSLAAASAAGEPALLAPLVDEVLATVGSDHPTATLRADVPPDLRVTGSAELHRLALRHLVRNAVEHHGGPAPVVEVTATYRPGDATPLHLAVLDDGPGIPTSETRVIERGTETQLEHTSSLGLWAVRWVVDRLGGAIAFERREPTGTAVRLRFPGVDRGGSGDGAADES